MRKAALLFSILLLAITNSGVAQSALKTDDGGTYTIEGTVYFKVVKKDAKGKVLYKVDTKIPDKAEGENYYELKNTNAVNFHLVGDRMIVVYDVWKGGTKTKDCQVKVLDTKTGKFGETKVLFASKVLGLFTSNEQVYEPFYTSDNTKLLVVKNNLSPGLNEDPEMAIYSTEDLSLLATIKIPGKYEGSKRIIDLAQLEFKNNGDISGVFQLMNEKTKVTTKSYSFDVAFKATELQNIKELGGNVTSEHNNDRNSHGHFYESLDDYIKDNPIPGVRIQNGSFTSSMLGVMNFRLLDDAGNVKKEKVKDLPAEIFSYKRNDNASPFAIRIIDKEPYIILSAGRYNFYSLYSDQGKLYMAEGWDGKLKKFNRKDLEKALDQHKLLNGFKNEKPKREFRDNVNDYFNKELDWYIKYFNLLNEKTF